MTSYNTKLTIESVKDQPIYYYIYDKDLPTVRIELNQTNEQRYTIDMFSNTSMPLTLNWFFSQDELREICEVIILKLIPVGYLTNSFREDITYRYKNSTNEQDDYLDTIHKHCIEIYNKYH